MTTQSRTTQLYCRLYLTHKKGRQFLISVQFRNDMLMCLFMSVSLSKNIDKYLQSVSCLTERTCHRTSCLSNFVHIDTLEPRLFFFAVTWGRYKFCMLGISKKFSNKIFLHHQKCDKRQEREAKIDEVSTSKINEIKAWSYCYIFDNFRAKSL